MQRTAHVCLNEQSLPILCTVEDMELEVNDFCVFQDADGMEHTGFLNTYVHMCGCQLKEREMAKILRRANSTEVRAWHYLKRREIEALSACKEKTTKHKLTMKISNVKFDDRQHKVIFFFTAEKRVDFRELVKDLASTFHARIELWQVGVRDEAKSLGGLGCCGLQMCCSSWMREFIPVSIRFAKNQDIQFSPNKLSGICGRLRCCLSYEQKQYQEMGKGVPPVGSMTQSEKHGRAKVIDRNLLTRTLTLLDAEGKIHPLSLGSAKCKKEKVKGAQEGAKPQNVWKIIDIPPVESEEEPYERSERKPRRTPSVTFGSSPLEDSSKASPAPSRERPKRKGRGPRRSSKKQEDKPDRKNQAGRKKTGKPSPRPSSTEEGAEKPARSRRRRRGKGPRRPQGEEGSKDTRTNKPQSSPQAKTPKDAAHKGEGKKDSRPNPRRRNRNRSRSKPPSKEGQGS